MKKYSFLTLLLFLNFTLVSAQEDLNIFGYYQGYFLHSSEYAVELPINPFINNGNPVFIEDGQEVNSFLLQQLNLFFQKDFSGEYGEFSTFVNFEVTNSYSSSKNWGTYNLEEAWVKYSLSDAFNVKMGLLIPKFNAMNEIKNRTPLFPYMFRPIVYETYVQTLVNLEDFVPEKAFLQVYGDLNLSDDFDFNYAVYLGNSEASYWISSAQDLSPTSTDFSKSKLFGGRIGITHEMFSLGVSGVMDKDNQEVLFTNDLLVEGNHSGIVMANLDSDLKRTKFGADLSATIGEFNLEAEYIGVNYDINDSQNNYIQNYRQNIQQAVVNTGFKALTLQSEITSDPLNPLNALKVLQLSDVNSFLGKLQDRAAENAQLGQGFDKSFYYVNLGYNASEEIQLYTNYSYIEDDNWIALESGMKVYSVGFAYKPVYSISLKGQYFYSAVDDLDFTFDMFLVGFSVLF